MIDKVIIALFAIAYVCICMQFMVMILDGSERLMKGLMITAFSAGGFSAFFLFFKILPALP